MGPGWGALVHICRGIVRIVSQVYSLFTDFIKLEIRKRRRDVRWRTKNPSSLQNGTFSYKFFSHGRQHDEHIYHILCVQFGFASNSSELKSIHSLQNVFHGIHPPAGLVASLLRPLKGFQFSIFLPSSSSPYLIWMRSLSMRSVFKSFEYESHCRSNPRHAVEEILLRCKKKKRIPNSLQNVFQLD